MNEPHSTKQETSANASSTGKTTSNQPAHSMRSRRTAQWGAKARVSDDGSSRYLFLNDCEIIFYKFIHVLKLPIKKLHDVENS